MATLYICDRCGKQTSKPFDIENTKFSYHKLDAKENRRFQVNIDAEYCKDCLPLVVADVMNVLFPMKIKEIK